MAIAVAMAVRMHINERRRANDARDRHLRSKRALTAQLLRHKLRRIFFRPRGARRCPAGRFAQKAAGGHGVWIMLVRSCSERAGRRRRPQNVIHPRDQMESERRRSRWTPRRRRATSPTLRCSRMSALASEVVWCQGLGWDPEKVRCMSNALARMVMRGSFCVVVHVRVLRSMCKQSINLVVSIFHSAGK